MQAEIAHPNIKTIAKNQLTTPRSIPDVLNQKYFPGLDGLRGISILMVIGIHILIARQNNNVWLNSIFNGTLGVTIFFNISGFIITTLLLKEFISTGTINLKDFYLRRAFRIFPVAYLFLLVLGILSLILHDSEAPGAFLIAALYVKNIFTSGGATAHFWSLSVEEQFYFMFPVILKKNLKTYLTLCLTLVLLIIPACTIIYFHVPSIAHNNWFFIPYALIRDLTGILIGSIFSILVFYKSSIFQKLSNPHLSVILLIGIILLNSTHPAFGRYQRFVYSGVITSILISTLIATNIFKTNNYFHFFLNNPLSIYLGKLSYSLYIWQQIFTVDILWKGQSSLSGSLLFNLVLLLIVANLSYYFFEKPIIKFKNRFRKI
jgi:peptidoglycan/LPS O-acetylase OafA/YrhL